MRNIAITRLGMIPKWWTDQESYELITTKYNNEDPEVRELVAELLKEMDEYKKYLVRLTF